MSGEVDVLDIGAGTGYFSIPAASLTTGTVYALDTEPAMLDMMRRRAQEQGLANIKVMEGWKVFLLSMKLWIESLPP